MNSKRGIIGSTIMIFVATLVIVLLLSMYLFGSSVVKLLDNDVGVSVYESGKAGEKLMNTFAREIIEAQISFYRNYSDFLIEGGDGNG